MFINSINTHLFIIHLSFIKLKDKTEVYNSIREYGVKEYFIEPSPLQSEYLDSLPLVIYSSRSFDDEEFELLEILKYPLYLSIRLKEVYNQLIVQLNREEVYLKYGKSIIKMLNSFEQYRYLSSVILTRAYQIHFNEYEKFKNIDYSTSPLGKEQLLIYSEILHEMNNKCLLPISDLCVIIYLTRRKNEDIQFSISNFSNKIGIRLNKSFQKGEEYSYSYSTKVSNLSLMTTYGFYIQDNPFNYYRIYVIIRKSNINPKKLYLISKLNVVNKEEYSFLEDLLLRQNNENKEVRLEFYIKKNKINENLLNILRILYFNTDEKEEYEKEIKTIEEGLKNKQIISIKNEIQALHSYINLIKLEIDEEKNELSYENIL